MQAGRAVANGTAQPCTGLAHAGLRNTWVQALLQPTLSSEMRCARGLRTARGTLSGLTTSTAEAGALSNKGIKHIWHNGLKYARGCPRLPLRGAIGMGARGRYAACYY